MKKNLLSLFSHLSVILSLTVATIAVVDSVNPTMEFVGSVHFKVLVLALCSVSVIMALLWITLRSNRR